MKYHINESITIDAPLEKIRTLIEDFTNWNSWSPWTIAEPGLTPTIEGTKAEAGHKMSWDGEIIGSGINTISKVEDNAIHYDLEFIKPFKSKAKTSFQFKKVESGIQLTWSMDSSMPFFLFFMIKKMKAWISMDYQRGLNMIKAMAEDGKVNAITSNEGIKNFDGFSYIGIKKTSTMEEMPTDMRASFEELINFLVQKHGKSAKHWVSIYTKTNMAKQEFTYIAAMSAEELQDIELPKHFIRGEIKDGNMLEVKHHGSYKFLGNAWSMASMFVRAKKIYRRGKPFEYYWNSPMEVNEEELKTSIYFPVK